MNVSITLATARRILTQLRHDPRTIVMMMLIPTLLMTLLRFVFNNEQQFSRVAPAMLGVFPFVIMLLLVTAFTFAEGRAASISFLSIVCEVVPVIAMRDVAMSAAIVF